MLRRLGAFLKASLAVIVLGLLTTVSAAIEPAHGQGRSTSAQIPTLLVANQTANTIREFSPTGKDLGDFASTGLNGPTGLAVDKHGNLYVSNIDGNTIREFSPTGRDLGDFASTGLNTPAGLAFDRDGNLLVSNRGDGTIRKFSPSGVDLGYFATSGMVTPVGLVFTPESEDEEGAS